MVSIVKRTNRKSYKHSIKCPHPSERRGAARPQTHLFSTAARSLGYLSLAKFQRNILGRVSSIVLSKGICHETICQLHTHKHNQKTRAFSLSLSHTQKQASWWNSSFWLTGKATCTCRLLSSLCTFSAFSWLAPQRERLHPCSMNFQRPREVPLCFTKAPQVPQGSRQPHPGHIQGWF